MILIIAHTAEQNLRYEYPLTLMNNAFLKKGLAVRQYL